MGLKDFQLTVEEGILVHLLRYVSYADMYTVPESVSQNGLSSALGIQRSHASSTLKIMRKKGLVQERLVHVRGASRKKKAYFLTADGTVLARTVADRIKDVPMVYIDGQGERHEVILEDAASLLGRVLSLGEMVSMTSEDMVLDLSPATTDSQVEQLEKTGVGMGDVPTVKKFFGRTEELAVLQSWLEDPTQRAMVVYGIAGIGKTTLVSTFVSKQATDWNVFWFRVHTWDSVRTVLSPLAKHLLALGKRKLATYIDGNMNIDMGEVQALIADDLKGLNSILVIEDIHDSKGNLLEFLTMLAEILESTPGPKLIVTGRKLVHFYDRRKVAVEDVVSELHLEGLDPDSARQVLGLDNIDDDEFGTIYAKTGGHPLTLELIETVAELEDLIMSHFDIRRYLQDEVMENLTKEEIELMGMISCLRYPCRADDLDDMFPDFDVDLLDHLMELNMITRSSRGYDQHPLLREFFYERLTAKNRFIYHNNIADNLVLKDTDKDVLEALYHYLQGERNDKVGPLLVERGPELFRKGYFEELLDLFDKVDVTQMDDITGLGMTLLCGHVLGFTGNWDDAEVTYQEAFALADKVEYVAGKAEALNGLGTLHLRRSELDLAMKCFSNALEDMGPGSEVMRSKINSNIALIHWMKEEWDEAFEINKTNLEVSESIGDMVGMARAYNNLGIIQWSQGDYDPAIESYEKGLELAKSLNDKRTISLILNNIGEVYRMKGEKDKATEYYAYSLELAQRLGYRAQIAEVYKNLSQTTEGEAAAREYLTFARNIYSQLGAEAEVEKVDELERTLFNE